MKRLTALLLSVALLLSGCSSAEKKTDESLSTITQEKEESIILEESDNTNKESDSTNEESIQEKDEEISSEDKLEEDSIPSFTGLDDPELLTYVINDVYANLENSFANEDYVIENVNAIYLSKEYVDELAYNSQSNVYFGYTLEELDSLFQGSRYIFTLGEDGQTDVRKMETFYDDSTEQVIKNVAIGGGVILLCVTVSVVTAGVGAPAVSMVFAASAKTATTFALSSAAISGAATTITTAYQTHDIEQALKAGTLSASEGFKWGAISGALIGGAKEANALRKASKVANASGKGTARTWQQSEAAAKEIYKGDSQVSFLGGKQVPASTPGSTRPDVVRTVGGKLEAIEVKNYDLNRASNRAKLLNELEREISDRVTNLPKGSLQRIVLDVQGKGYSDELIKTVMDSIWARLGNIYPNIPIDLI